MLPNPNTSKAKDVARELAARVVARAASTKPNRTGHGIQWLCPLCGIAPKFRLQCTKMTLYACMYG